MVRLCSLGLRSSSSFGCTSSGGGLALSLSTRPGTLKDGSHTQMFWGPCCWFHIRRKFTVRNTSPMVNKSTKERQLVSLALKIIFASVSVCLFIDPVPCNLYLVTRYRIDKQTNGNCSQPYTGKGSTNK